MNVPSFNQAVGLDESRTTGPTGGLVFYDKGSYSDGWRYLEAAPSDQSTGIRWYNVSYTTTGATATAIGTGGANTATIVANQGVGSYAAQICNDLTIGSYSDWFLPSKEELNQMYVNLHLQGSGGFTSEWYWSSSEHSSSSLALVQHFGSGSQSSSLKGDGAGYPEGNDRRVRAVRAF